MLKCPKYDRLRIEILEAPQRENITLELPELIKNLSTRKLLIDFVSRTENNIEKTFHEKEYGSSFVNELFVSIIGLTIDPLDIWRTRPQ